MGLDRVGGERIPLGEWLVHLQKLDRKGLGEALREQESGGRKLGEILVDRGLLTAAELEQVLTLQGDPDGKAPLVVAPKLGDLLLASEQITREQLEEALREQKVSTRLIGDVLVEMGFVSARDLDRALRLQDSLQFTSRQRLLDQLDARIGPDRAAGDALQLPPGLQGPFPSRQAFYDAAIREAFLLAYGREATVTEDAALKARMSNLAGGTGPLLEPAVREDFYSRLVTMLQNQLAERILRLAGGDWAQRSVDRQGRVQVGGLDQADLAAALEVVTDPAYDPAMAHEHFLERSARAYFRSKLGRDFASPTEAADFEGDQGKLNRELLKRLQGILQDGFSAFSLLQREPAAMAGLLPDEEELRSLLKRMRLESDEAAYRAWLDREWFFRKLELARDIEAGLKIRFEKARAKKALDQVKALLERILGKIPAKLAGLLERLVAMIGSDSIPNVAALEAMILQLIEQIMQLLQRMEGGMPSPDRLEQLLEAALSGLAEGQDPMQAVFEAIQGQAGQVMDSRQAMQVVAAMNFHFKGDLGGLVDPEDPWVQALVSGQYTPETMRTAFEDYYAGTGTGIPLQDAVAFVEYLYRAVRGVQAQVSPDDPDVGALTSGASTPGGLLESWQSFSRQGD
ncbi:MAG: hypothetical protein VKP72_06790 [bacterium]|nr:hypothetical protein [bacterium]